MDAFPVVGSQCVQPTCVVTQLHATKRTLVHRSRSIHEAIARRLPIVGTDWLHACEGAGKWADTAPFFARSDHRTTGPGVFATVLATIDRACSTVAVGKYAPGISLADDVRRWISLCGGVVADEATQVDLVRAGVKMHVHVVLDKATGKGHVLNNWMEREARRIQLRSEVVDIPWVSHCLISGEYGASAVTDSAAFTQGYEETEEE